MRVQYTNSYLFDRLNGFLALRKESIQFGGLIEKNRSRVQKFENTSRIGQCLMILKIIQKLLFRRVGAWNFKSLLGFLRGIPPSSTTGSFLSILSIISILMSSWRRPRCGRLGFWFRSSLVGFWWTRRSEFYDGTLTLGFWVGRNLFSWFLKDWRRCGLTWRI